MENIIKNILKDKGMTVASLAEKVGITQPNMSNIVNGKSNPSIDTLGKIALVLDVSVGSLFQSESELYGLLLFRGKTYRIDSDQALQTFLNDYSSGSVGEPE
jgi:transcriptional regulator with XRE-family HTH domain